MNFFSNKTILVTGATGLIGSNLIDVLMQYPDVRIIALGRNKEKLNNAFKCYANNPNFISVVQDISQPLKIESPVDLIFHAAGPMEREIVINHPLNVIWPNIIGTKNCFDFMVKQKETIGKSCRMILFSSVTVYDNNGKHTRTVTEQDTETTEKLDAIKASYSQSKRMSEVIATSYNKQYGTDSVIARFSTVYGTPRFIPNTAFFEFINNALLGNDISVSATNASRRDNIYIDDAISGLLLIAQKGVCGEAYNISSNGDAGNFAAIDEIANSIADVINTSGISHKKIRVLSSINNINRYPGLKLDNTKLKLLGWSISTSLSDGIRQTVMKIHQNIKQK